MPRHCFPPTWTGGSWRKCVKRPVLLSLVVITAILSLIYVTVAARNYEGVSLTLSPSLPKSGWCPYYPSSVDEIGSMFDSKSLLELENTVKTKLSKDTHISLLVASESVLLMLINWMCVTRRRVGSLPKNLLVVVPPGNSSVIMKLGSKGIPVVQMEFRWVCM